MLKQITRKIIPFEKWAKFFWRYNTLKLALASSLNAPRNNGEAIIAEKFNNYFFGMSAEKKDEISKNLKKDLDKNSQQEVNRIIFRQDYILKHNLIDQKKLFSSEELSEQKICRQESSSLRKKIKNFAINTYSAESFYGLNGARWLPEAKNKTKKRRFPGYWGL